MNADCFNDHLVDDPGCQCGHTYEDICNYLFECPLHNNSRPYLTAIHLKLGYINAHILVNGLLFADDITCTNNFMLENIISYVKSTKRFNV